MSLNDFFKYLEGKPIEDYIVKLRYKYSWEPDWNYSNEIIIEKQIAGREFTVAVNNGKVIGALEIVSNNNNNFYVKWTNCYEKQ